MFKLSDRVFGILMFLIMLTLISTVCQMQSEQPDNNNIEAETHEYFLLHPEVEKAYGYLLYKNQYPAPVMK